MLPVMRALASQHTEAASLPIHAAVAALAAGRHGVVSRAQLRGIGMSDTAITGAVARGQSHTVRRGVFAVGHPLLGAHGRWMAAVPALGPGTRISHGSAADPWAIRRSATARIDATVPGTGGRRRRLGVHRGIPVTSAARTLLDLAAILDERGLERALDRAEQLELTDYPALDALARARPGHHGAGKLRRALTTHEAGTTITRSELEELFLALCRRHGLPKPLVNSWLEAKQVDFLFPRHRLIVETDSWTHHRSRQAFENDRARDALMARAGYRTLRFTYRQIEQEPAGVAATLRSHISRP